MWQTEELRKDYFQDYVVYWYRCFFLITDKLCCTKILKICQLNLILKDSNKYNVKKTMQVGAKISPFFPTVTVIPDYRTQFFLNQEAFD